MATKKDLLSMQNCLCFNLRRASRAVTQFFDAEVRRHGIRPTQTTILATLAAKANWAMDDLSDWLGTERTTLVRNLRPLKRDGWIQITGGGRGSRVAISITAKGRNELETVMPAWRSAQRKAIETLGEQRWSSILADLEHACRELSK